MNNKNNYKPFDLEISFDKLGFIETAINRWDFQDKVNDLLNIQQDYEYLEECRRDLRRLKKIKKKTKDIQEEIWYIEIEIDKIEEYIKLILQSVTKH